jgi:hypothetical protein
VSGVELRVIEDHSLEHFAQEAAFGLAELDDCDLAPGNLCLPLGLSLWMQRAGVGLRAARDTLLQLRDALIAASGLDAHTEPVPLVVADPETSALSLARYVEGLLRRAAYVTYSTRLEVAERALAVMSD